MKTRSGFVSNSSSSSFVVVGVQLSETDFKKMGGYEFFEKKFNYVNLPEGEDKAILGEKLGRWSEGEDGICNRDISEVLLSVEKVKMQVQTLFPTQQPKVQLIYGSVYG